MKKAPQKKANNKPHLSVLSFIIPKAEDEVVSYIPSMATLERLPAELQIAILLNIGDIGSLESLIRASPRYHSLYVSQRHAILKQVLFNSIHPDALYDAYSAIESTNTTTSDRKDRAVKFRTFVSNYSKTRDTWVPPEHLDLETLSRLAWLQNHVQHSTQDLYRVASSSHPFPGTQMVHCEEISVNESRRFYRAFYRFHIFCNLFRNWETPPDDVLLSDSSDEDDFEPNALEKSSWFLSLFNPWEVEELACVRDYFFKYYRRMLHQFEADLHERDPDFNLSEDGNGSFLNIQHRKQKAD